MQTGSSGTLIGWKSGQTTFVPLWDRIEGAWLRTEQCTSANRPSNVLYRGLKENTYSTIFYFIPFYIKIAKNSKCTGREKTSEIRDINFVSFQICVITNLSAPSCVSLCSFCFWGEVSNSWILNNTGRNSLLGNRKKIAKFFMRTFTCRSAFLYGIDDDNN